jgi:hypothetical protein
MLLTLPATPLLLRATPLSTLALLRAMPLLLPVMPLLRKLPLPPRNRLLRRSKRLQKLA